MRTRLLLDFPVLWFLVWTCAGLPALAWISYRRLKAGVPLPPKWRRYLATALILIVTATLAGIAGLEIRVRVWRQPLPDLGSAVIGACILAAALIGATKGYRRAPEEKKATLRLLYFPETRAQRWAWVVISFLAGTCEEITYRGVLWALLAVLLGNWYAAAGMSILVFALAHMTQGWKSMIGVAYLALIFHLLVWWSGGLLVAMGVHALYDLVFTLFAVHHDSKTHVPASAAAASS